MAGTWWGGGIQPVCARLCVSKRERLEIRPKGLSEVCLEGLA